MSDCSVIDAMVRDYAALETERKDLQAHLRAAMVALQDARRENQVLRDVVKLLNQ